MKQINMTRNAILHLANQSAPFFNELEYCKTRKNTMDFNHKPGPNTKPSLTKKTKAT